MALYSRIVCFISLILFSVFNYAHSFDCRQNHCVAVVDAGSSGSRLHVYSYELDETNTPVNIYEKWSKNVKPGFSAIQANQKAVNAYLTNLFSRAPEAVMPVFFYATAGMRLLPQSQQQRRYEYLNNWFRSQSTWSLMDSKTITGTEEGVFDWLAINYQLGTLNSDSKKQVGVMDMGGASVQIVFPIANSASLSSDVKEISVYGRQFKIFVHSFLGLGQTEVTHQFLNTNSCFMLNYRLPCGLSAHGDAYLCEKEVSTLMNAVHHIHRIVHPMIRLSLASKWYAVSSIVHLVKSKPFRFSDSQFTNRELLAQSDTALCHQKWSRLQSLYPNDEYLHGYCLFPSYYYALMVDGYGLKANQPIHFMHDNQNADWTMGVPLQEIPNRG